MLTENDVTQEEKEDNPAVVPTPQRTRSRSRNRHPRDLEELVENVSQSSTIDPAQEEQEHMLTEDSGGLKDEKEDPIVAPPPRRTRSRTRRPKYLEDYIENVESPIIDAIIDAEEQNDQLLLQKDIDVQEEEELESTVAPTPRKTRSRSRNRNPIDVDEVLENAAEHPSIDPEPEEEETLPEMNDSQEEEEEKEEFHTPAAIRTRSRSKNRNPITVDEVLENAVEPPSIDPELEEEA